MWESDSNETWRVVINQEDQYSLWPVRREIPYGWREVGRPGTKDECLGYIKANWTDMRPRSLKEQMVGPSNTDRTKLS